MRMLLTIGLPLFLPVILYTFWWLAVTARASGDRQRAYGDGPFGTLVLIGLLLALGSLVWFVLWPEWHGVQAPSGTLLR